MRRIPTIGLLCILALCRGVAVTAQDFSPRLGFGPEFLINANDDRLSDRNAGFGLRFRASFPLNTDVSLSAGTGLVGFLFDGQSNADYAVNPQASVIVQLPGRTWAPYIAFGGGGLLVLSGPDGANAAGTIQAAYGWARFLSEISAFVEINPMLVLRDEATKFVLGARTGLIF